MTYRRRSRFNRLPNDFYTMTKLIFLYKPLNTFYIFLCASDRKAFFRSTKEKASDSSALYLRYYNKT